MLSALPLEMLEFVLMRAFLLLYLSDVEPDDDESPVILGKTRNTESRAFTLLSSVCSHWYQTFTGWPQSDTHHWLRHKLKKQIERKYTYTVSQKKRSHINFRHSFAICWDIFYNLWSILFKNRPNSSTTQYSIMFVYVVVGWIETASYTKCTKSALIRHKTLKINE